MKSEAIDTLRLERTLPGPIERVWRYLTDSELRGTWLAKGQMDLHAGGTVQLTWFNSRLTNEPPPDRFAGDDGHSMQGEVLTCDPPHVLVFTWPQKASLTEVRFELEAHGADVRLVLTHSRLATRGQRIGVTAGWNAHLHVLEQRLGGVTEPVGFWADFLRREAEAEAQLPG